MDNKLVPRTGPPTKLSSGPKIGQQSLYHQRVLDEDTYTDALSHIITRDFFPNLPQIHATNAYLSALTNNDPELLSSSIRRLASLSNKEDRPVDDFSNTPAIRPSQTPLGGGWETPSAGPSRKRQKLVRDDLTLDAFQRNYTSEDNASFVQIVDEENQQRREERWGWAWKAEAEANTRRLEGEERRKTILDTATSGQWRVNAEGKRLVGALSEGGQESEGAWRKPLVAITAGASLHHTLGAEEELGDEQLQHLDTSELGTALVTRQSDSAVILRDDGAQTQEKMLPASHPLSVALQAAGLPPTAIVSEGAIIPHRPGQAQLTAEKSVLEDERPEYLSLAGSGGDLWGYKTRNNFMFPADADTDPYPKPRLPTESRQAPPLISHDNTRLPDEVEDVPSRSQRGSSPTRSLVAAAVRGRGDTDTMPSINNYPLLPNEPSPSPQDLPSLLTWGTLAATPRALDSDDPLESAPSFKMPETKRREEIGRKLADKASRSMNQRAQGFTPKIHLSAALRSAAEKTHRSVRGDSRQMLPPSTPRRDSLTPAAKRLLENTLGKTGGRNRGAAMERVSAWSSKGTRDISWTPSPRR